MRIGILVLALAFLGADFLHGAEPLPRILLYTRNGLTIAGKKGYIHANIPSSVAAIEKLGAEHRFAVDVSDAPAVFTDANLKKYRALVFSNTNNEILDTAEQRAALQRYIRGGGGFAGIHSACGSMRDWPWFWSLIGGTFVRHPKLQEFTMKVVDRKHPSTAFLGETWRWTDEFYYLREMPASLRVLLEGDLTTLVDPQKPAGETSRPLAWYQHFEGGRSWYTTLGHQKEAYSDPTFQKHILGGILWAMGATKEKK
jgi:type 1 glutamine amidotransferase